MDTLVLGEGPLSLHTVAEVIEKSPSFATLQMNWKIFAIYIGVDDAELPDLEVRICSGSLKLKEVPREILKIWKAEKGKNASMTTLCKALDQCNLSGISDSLKAKFCSVKPEEQVEFILQNKIYTLERLFENNVPDQVSKIIKNGLQARLFSEPIRIIRTEVWPLDLPLYYIPRTLCYRNELDERIFRVDATRKHIFLVKGATKPELARACGYKPVERSENQLKKVTVQHILLENDDHFHRICRIITKPVHMIEYKDKSFYHLKSSAGMDKVQAFVKENGVFFRENWIAKTITELNSPTAISIADSPGMGKTYILSKLFAHIQEIRDEEIILFIVLQELTPNLNPSTLQSPNSVIEVITTYASSNILSKLILQEMLKNGNHHFILLLDGYDEVMQDKLHLIDSLLYTLNRLPNIKIIVTTRPHLKSRLENILHRLSFQILPFDESNQIEFLMKYWSNKHGASNSKMLLEFAKKCLQSLEMIMSDTERDIAGIPFQCFMLAEVYAMHARRASKLNSLPEDIVRISSFFEMHKLLMEVKFKRIGNSIKQRVKYLNAHVHDAIALLFPSWLEKFMPLLTPRQEVEEAMMYSIGIIEKSPSSNIPRFLHRSFAENLLAQFTVWNLGNNSTCVEFLYTEIFCKAGTTMDERLSNHDDAIAAQPGVCKLRHPGIAYFVEMHLRDRVWSDETKALELLNSFDPANISDEDVCIALTVCCCYGLEACFDLTKNILTKLNIKRNFNLQEKYFKRLPHLVVENTENVMMLKKILTLTMMEFQVNRQWHVVHDLYMFANILQIRDCTPLHLAVYHGKFNMVIYLLEEYGQDVQAINHLMHCCLIQSSKNSESIIEDKISIIESLNRIHPDWLVEHDFYGRKPILMERAHVKLIKYMVQLGCDINTYNERIGTILHLGGEKHTYSDLVRWALCNGFTRINHVDGDGSTPLSVAIKRFGILDDHVLRLYIDAGANINAQNRRKDAPLIEAIKWSKSVDFVKKLLDFGANPTHTNMDGENAAHVIIRYIKDPTLALDFLRLLESKGFTGLHEKDIWGNTPVKDAIHRGVTDEEILKYFCGAGADVDGNSILFYALEHGKSLELVQKLLNIGENVRHQNRTGENAGHLVIKYQSKNPQLALELLKILEMHGFKGYDQLDSNSRTPSKLAKDLQIKDYKLLEFLSDRSSRCPIQ